MKTIQCLLAISGAALLATPALAEDLEVHLYGTLLPFAENARVTDATAPGLSPATGGATQVPGSAYTGANLPNRFRMTSGTSNLGFKGSLPLNESLKVFWQVESAVSPDGDPPNFLAGRNTAVGLTGPWGTAFYGQWDTPYKFPLLFTGPLRGLSPFDDAITANPGFNVPGTTTQTGRADGKADAAFNRRQGNSIQYWSPNLYGFTGRLAYSLNEGKTPSTAARPGISPDIWSALLTYQNGPFGARYGFEHHKDYFGLAQLGGAAGDTWENRSSWDNGNELVAWYTLPTQTKVTAIYERLTYNAGTRTAGAVNHYHRDALFFLAQQHVGPHQIWASLGLAFQGSCEVVGGGACSTDGLGGRQWSIGYSYSLARSADLFAAYYQMDNDRSATHAVFPSPGTLAPGSTTRGIGVGFLYTFDAAWKLAL